MVVGELPAGSEERLVPLGHLGNRLGSAHVSVPFGRGRLHLVGTPLLDAIDGRIDPRRDARLAALLREVVVEVRTRLAAAEAAAAGDAAWQAPTGEWLEEFAYGQQVYERLVALGDRASPFITTRGQQGQLPDMLSTLVAGRDAALVAVMEGEFAPARAHLLAALGPVWNDQTRGLLGLEEEVLALLGERIHDAGRDDWDSAYDGVEHWARGVGEWFAGDTALALAWLGRARLELGRVAEEPEAGADGLR
jgi:hypothetical protein